MDEVRFGSSNHINIEKNSSSSPVDVNKEDQSRKCTLVLLKVSLVALCVFGGMLCGAGAAVAIVGLSITPIITGAALGALVAIGALLLAKITLIFIHAINKKSSYEELSHAAQRLKQYFDHNPGWFKKENIFYDLQTPSYDYSVKENVKNELMNADNSIVEYLSKIDQSEHQSIHQASRFSTQLKYLNQAKENERPYVAADILKDLYKEMNLLGRKSQIERLLEFASSNQLDELLKVEQTDEDFKVKLNCLINEVLEPKNKNDFNHFMDLLSNAKKEQKRMKISRLGAMAAKVLCDDSYNPLIVKVM